MINAIKRGLHAVLRLSPAAKEQNGVKATELLKTVTTMTGQKLKYPSKNPQVTATLVEIPHFRNLADQMHVHPNIRYVYVIEGTLTNVLENGTRRNFPAGTFFVEPIATVHANDGRALALYIDHSEEGQSNFVRRGPRWQGSREQPAD